MTNFLCILSIIFITQTLHAVEPAKKVRIRNISLNSFNLAAEISSEMGSFQKNDGSNYSIRSSIYGANFGYRKAKSTQLFFWENSLTVGQANNQSATAGLNYFHRGAKSYALRSSPGWSLRYAKLPSIANLGVIFPVTFRSLHYSIPDANYTAKSTQSLFLHFGFDLNWSLTHRLILNQKMLFPIVGSGTIWTAGFSFSL